MTPPRRALEDLIDVREPGWPVVEALIAQAAVDVRVLPTAPERAARTLSGLQVTTRSPMGALAFGAAGLLVDHGWLRILGAGGVDLNDGLLEWNTVNLEASAPGEQGYLIVAHDAAGGFFALDGGALADAPRTICYLSPDSLSWEPLDIGYTQFLGWALSGALSRFAADMRGPAWIEELAALDADRGLAYYPPPWAACDGGLSARMRAPVPMRGLWRLAQDTRRQLG